MKVIYKTLKEGKFCAQNITDLEKKKYLSPKLIQLEYNGYYWLTITIIDAECKPHIYNIMLDDSNRIIPDDEEEE